MVFPTLPDVPLDPYRSALYTAAELYGDAALRQQPRRPRLRLGGVRARPRRAARGDAARPRRSTRRSRRGWRAARLVGVMGGHALRRGEPGYADAARLGRLLGAHPHRRHRRRSRARWRRPTSAPGWRRARRRASTPCWRAVARVPDYRGRIGAWAGAGLDALDELRPTTDTLGIPTWHYGHEPPNVFASAIAKYFRNAVREAVLLRDLRRRHRVPARGGGHRAGGVPGRLRELLRRPGVGRADGAGRPRALDRGAPRLAAAAPLAPTGGRWRRTCTSSTPSRRPPTVDRLTPVAGLSDSVAASWPQAPSISRPRVSRTVVGMPLASSRRTNSRSSAGSEAVHFEPGVGLSGIRLTWTQPQSPYG